MADLNDVVNVEVNLQEPADLASSFGDLLIVAAANAAAPDGVTEYAMTPDGLAEMVADGFTQNDSGYVKAQEAAGIQPHIATAKIFKRTTNNAQEKVFTITAAPVGFELAFDVWIGQTKTAVSYVVQAVDTPTDAATALAALVGAISGITVVDNADGTFNATPDDDVERFFENRLSRNIDVEDISVDGGIADQLDAAKALNSDWYAFTIDGNSQAEIEAAAAWAKTNERLLIAMTNDSKVWDANVSNDVASTLKTNENLYSAIYATRNARESLATVIAARQLSRDPGSSNWANQNLSGVIADDFTSSETAALKAKNVNFYCAIGNTALTFEGKSSEGRHLDLVRGLDWLRWNIQNHTLAIFREAEKIGFTTQGIAEISDGTRIAAGEAETATLLAEGWEVITPIITDFSAAQKKLRKLTGVKLNAVLQGAVNSIEIVVNVRF